MASVLIAVLLGGAGVARAQEPRLFFAADAAGERGYVTLYVTGSSYAEVEIGERVGSAVRPVTTVNLGELPGLGFGGKVLQRALRWRCDRLTRRLVASARNPDGSVESAAFSVRTPSCRDRLAVTLPRAAPAGARVRVEVRDRWRIGGVRGRLCTRPPDRRARCRTLRIAQGRARSASTFRPRRRGRWRVEIRAPAQRIRRALSVGVRAGPPRRRAALPTILATGDSLMQSVYPLLSDRLAGRARIESDVHAGSGLSKSFIVDWQRLARRQAARLDPDATVVFLGSNDGFDMATPDGGSVECCGEPWIAEYARRARRVMGAYARGGEAEVFWLSLPSPRDVRRQPASFAVNAAVLRAAAAVPGVHVVRLDELFTPGGRYRATMRYRDRRLRVREGDGIHLSVPGSAIATTAVIRFLERFGPL